MIAICLGWMCDFNHLLWLRLFCHDYRLICVKRKRILMETIKSKRKYHFTMFFFWRWWCKSSWLLLIGVDETGEINLSMINFIRRYYLWWVCRGSGADRHWWSCVVDQYKYRKRDSKGYAHVQNKVPLTLHFAKGVTMAVVVCRLLINLDQMRERMTNITKMRKLHPYDRPCPKRNSDQFCSHCRQCCCGFSLLLTNLNRRGELTMRLMKERQYVTATCLTVERMSIVVVVEAVIPRSN